jgi:hypothetical protein
MTTRLNIYLVLGTVFMLLTWLLVGLFRNGEFYEPTLFTKNRPTFKVNFYSPIGMQDLELKDLSPDGQLEEIAFQEFVVGLHQQYNADAKLWYLPLILIQLTLTFLTFGFFKPTRTIHSKMWQLPTHLATNFIVTSIGIGFMLLFDNILSTILLTSIIMAINYGTVILLTRQKSKPETNLL